MSKLKLEVGAWYMDGYGELRRIDVAHDGWFTCEGGRYNHNGKHYAATRDDDKMNLTHRVYVYDTQKEGEEL